MIVSMSMLALTCPLFYAVLSVVFLQKPLVVTFEMLSLAALFVFGVAYLFRQEPFEFASQIILVAVFRGVVPAVSEHTRAILASVHQEAIVPPVLQDALRRQAHRYRLRNWRKERDAQWQTMEIACPTMEEARKSRRRKEMAQRWATLANLLGLLPESKSAMARLCAKAETWKSEYQARRAVEHESTYLLEVEKMAAEKLVREAGAIEDLRKTHGCGCHEKLMSARTFAMKVGVRGDHPDMQRNAEESVHALARFPARRQMNLRPAFEYKGSGQKLSLLAQVTSKVAGPLGGFRAFINGTTGDDGYGYAITLADDGYVITYRRDTKGVLPPNAAIAAQVASPSSEGDCGAALVVTWLDWDASLADYEANRHVSPAETKWGALVATWLDWDTSRRSRRRYIESYDSKRRTVAWALSESMAREARIEALCAIGRERIRAKAAER